MNLARAVSFDHEMQIAALWHQGMDTLRIARTLCLHEWQVANELPRLRHRKFETGESK